ncbi:MAG: DUF6527 family protein [Phycisphaerales bacterium]
MKSLKRLQHRFVEFIPERPEDGVLYISIEHATAVHRCCCGCGLEVVTPLTPTDWSMTFNGIAVSLHPSIGNWSFPCRSHYWIRSSRVEWAAAWTAEEVVTGRQADAANKQAQFAPQTSLPTPVAAKPVNTISQESTKPIRAWWRRLTPWI